MGGWWSNMLWGGDPDLANPISGLSLREIYAVQKSWAPIYANSAVNGVELFRRLFAAYPKTKEYFKVVRNLPEEKFLNSHQFKAHAINLMSSLNQAISNLNEPEVAAAMMNKLGESHSKRKIREQDFLDLKKVILQMFTEVPKLDSATLGTWNKTVDFLYKHIFEALNNQAQIR